MTVRVRFAPSPTGYLHVGGLRTALYNWLYARQNNGAFVLRIEDTDQSRKVEGAVDNLLEALRWAGITPDEGPGIGGDKGPYTQSERLDIYQRHVQQLLDTGHAYTCFCTPERLEQLRERQRKLGSAPKYDGKCRGIEPDEAANRARTKPHVVRLKVPETGRIVVQDVVRKKVAFDWQQVDDQVLLKGDGFPTYHLANVVDDHLMGITHVIRGEEWLPSMPKHLFLYQSFGWEPPVFAHLPLLLNKDRSKLSKRQGHVAVEDYRADGFLPKALVNFVALLGWHAKDNQEVFSTDDLIRAFELERVQKGGAIFDTDKLRWINGQHLRQLPFDEFKAAAKDVLEPGWDVTDRMLESVHGKINMLADIPEQLGFFFEEPVKYDDASTAALAGEEIQAILSAVCATLESLGDFDGQTFLDAVKAVGKEQGLKGKELWHPVRAAICGRVAGPDMITIVETFGAEKVRRRIADALS